jgi:AcrR family transcriptional regulator
MALSELGAPELRQDARLRRERILSAAQDLFRTEGLGVPLERIAERAGVGRATLYRNFPDREALLEAALQVSMNELAGQMAQWADRDDAFFLGIRAMAGHGLAVSCFDFIVPLHRHDPTFTQRIRASFEDLLAEPLARAKAAGLVREDFALEHIYLMVIMTAAGGLQDVDGNTVAGMDRALDLLARGYAPQRAT